MKKVKLDNTEKIITPFEVPENYFMQLERNIQERISVPTEEKVHGFKMQWAFVPAILVILISLTLLVVNQESVSHSDKLIAELSDDEILAYLEFSNISEDEILKLTDEPEALISDDINYLDGLDLQENELEELIHQMDLENEWM